MTYDIPAGYQLHVTTWENDGDHYNTEIISGLTEADVRFLLDVAKQFGSRNSTTPGLGNGSVKGEQLVALLREKLADHPEISDDIKQVWSEGSDEDIAYDILTDLLLGTPQEEGYFDELYFCRVFDDFKVYYFPETIKDVTQSFA